MITFHDDRIVGSDGCNELTGTLLAASSGLLTLADDIGGTDMGCETPIMEQAEQFAEALLQAHSYTVDGNELHVMNSDGAVILRFTRESTAVDPALSAHSWILVEIDGQPARSEPSVTLDITEDRVSGHDGCNAFSGDLILLGDGALDIANLLGTYIGCDAPIAEQASRVTGSLSFATAYHLDGDRLTIGADGGPQLVFAPLDAAMPASTP